MRDFEFWSEKLTVKQERTNAKLLFKLDYCVNNVKKLQNKAIKNTLMDIQVHSDVKLYKIVLL